MGSIDGSINIQSTFLKVNGNTILGRAKSKDTTTINGFLSANIQSMPGLADGIGGLMRVDPVGKIDLLKAPGMTLLGNAGSSAAVPQGLNAASIKSLLEIDKEDVSGFSTTSSHTFNNMILAGDLTVYGSTVMQGTTITVDQETVLIKDNIIQLNSNAPDLDAEFLQSGIEVNRYEKPSYYFVFDETKTSFCIGEISSLQRVATRQDEPIDNGIPFWNEDAFRFDTLTGLTKDNIAFEYGDGLTFSGNKLSINESQKIAKITGISGSVSGLLKIAADGELSRDITAYLSQVPAYSTGDIRGEQGTTSLTIADGVVSLSKMGSIGATTLIGNNTNSDTTPSALSITQVKTMLQISPSDISGLSTTTLGQTGNSSPSTFAENSQASYSNLPIGFSGTVNSTSAGLPLSQPCYLFKLANLNANGGWTGLAIDTSDSGSMYYGRASASTAYATWIELVDTNSTQDLTNKTWKGALSLNGSLTMSATDAGFRPPVVTSTEKVAITGTSGLTVYDSTLGGLQTFDTTRGVVAADIWGPPIKIVTCHLLGMSGLIAFASPQTLRWNTVNATRTFTLSTSYSAVNFFYPGTNDNSTTTVQSYLSVYPSAAFSYDKNTGYITLVHTGHYIIDIVTRRIDTTSINDDAYLVQRVDSTTQTLLARTDGPATNQEISKPLCCKGYFAAGAQIRLIGRSFSNFASGHTVSIMGFL